MKIKDEKMLCKLCSTQTIVWEDSQFNHHYYYCPHCELISQEQREYPNEQESIKIYEQHNNSIENEGYVQMFKGFLDETVMPFRNKGKKALDFGSGPSPVLAEILKRDYGYDVNIYDLFYANDNSYKHCIYDLITSTEVIEHVDQPLGFLENLAMHIGDDGVIGIMTLFHTNNKEHFMDWFYRRDITHISFYTPKTFQYMAKHLGLELIYHDNKRCLALKKVKHEEK